MKLFNSNKQNCMQWLESNHQKCCGCSSCVNTCPRSAIKMETDERGFLVPCIDEKKCNKCGLCTLTCPIITPLAKTNSYSSTPNKYAFVSDEKTLNKSSSGGAFSVLATHVINHGGYVCGAAFSENEFVVKHRIINDLKDLDSLRLSKYVQSDQNDCYTRVKKLLNQKETVLYVGTPCQIAGLRSFLRDKDHPNLYTVDLLCHGVPPYKLLKDYLDKNFGLENISKINFRKPSGWVHCLDVHLKDGTIIEQKKIQSIYMRLFLKDLVLKDTCYGCKFASLPRCGDITIGDMWSASKLKLGMPYEKKSSIVLVNSSKGNALWSNIINSHKECHFQNITHVENKFLNKNIYKANSKYSDNSKIFWEKYKQTMNINESFAAATLGDNPVGLVMYGSNNYGSCATNLALYKAIENLGLTPVILDTFVPLWGVSKNYLYKKCKLSSSFISDNSYEGIKFANRIFSSYVVGSDYSMNIGAPNTLNHLEFFLMAFAEKHNRKISYAPSLGMPDFNDEFKKTIYKTLLERFDFLSFREVAASERVNKFLGIESKTVLDPVFLIDKNVYSTVAEGSSINEKDDYILVYMMDPTPEKLKVIEFYQKRLNLRKFVILGISDYDKNKSFFPTDLLGKVPFEDYMYYFAHAKYVITDSFHGTCFSLIFNKKFISIKNRTKNRFDALLHLFKDIPGMPIYSTPEEAYMDNIATKDYHFDAINRILEKKRVECNNFLNTALHLPVEKDNDESSKIYYDYAVLWRTYEQQNRQNSVQAPVESKYTKMWNELKEKIQTRVPSYIEFSKDNSKSYYKMFIKGINTKIHYELLSKDNKLFFCLHCEDEKLKVYCNQIFMSVKNILGLNNNDNDSLFKLNKVIENEPDISILFYLINTQKQVSDLLKIKELSR